nr:hypothetical protein CFP56_21313 [Quercus suber]
MPGQLDYAEAHARSFQGSPPTALPPEVDRWRDRYRLCSTVEITFDISRKRQHADPSLCFSQRIHCLPRLRPSLPRFGAGGDGATLFFPAEYLPIPCLTDCQSCVLDDIPDHRHCGVDERRAWAQTVDMDHKCGCRGGTFRGNGSKYEAVVEADQDPISTTGELHHTRKTLADDSGLLSRA